MANILARSMYRVEKTVSSEHSVEDLYTLVNDTESYKLFLPFCRESQVLSQQGNEKICRLVFSQSPVNIVVETKNILTPNQQIEIFRQGGDFEHLYGRWLFEPVNTGASISIEFEYAFKSRLLHYTLGHVLSTLTEEAVDIFCRRANELSLY